MKEKHLTEFNIHSFRINAANKLGREGNFLNPKMVIYQKSTADILSGENESFPPMMKPVISTLPIDTPHCTGIASQCRTNKWKAYRLERKNTCGMPGWLSC